MIALVLCALAFTGCYFATRHSLIRGLIAVMCVGYMYGIVRANFPSSFSHFIFDAGLVGFYVNEPWRSPNSQRERTKQVNSWASLLIGWPLFVCLLPFQTFMITLVGLRGNIFLLPMLAVGSRLKNVEVQKLAMALAVLNVVTLGFGTAEYFLGVPKFFPIGPATALIYNSNDVAGYQFLRIPGTFTNAHVYAGTMTVTVPLLLGLILQPAQSGRMRLLGLAGIAAALFGILFSATRTSVVICLMLIVFALLFAKVAKSRKMLVLAGLVAIGFVAIGNERFNRFTTLGDTDAVSGRIAGSVNRSFWEVLAEYPLGNGLGGGGTSIPYFLEHELNRPVTIESEYGRILLEQGIIGLALWVAFVVWFLTRRKVAFRRSPWQLSRQLGWIYCVISFAGALIGVGLLLAVPQSPLFVLMVGWVSTSPEIESPARWYFRSRPSTPQRIPAISQYA